MATIPLNGSILLPTIFFREGDNQLSSVSHHYGQKTNVVLDCVFSIVAVTNYLKPGNNRNLFPVVLAEIKVSEGPRSLLDSVIVLSSFSVTLGFTWPHHSNHCYHLHLASSSV